MELWKPGIYSTSLSPKLFLQGSSKLLEVYVGLQHSFCVSNATLCLPALTQFSFPFPSHYEAECFGVGEYSRVSYLYAMLACLIVRGQCLYSHVLFSSAVMPYQVSCTDISPMGGEGDIRAEVCALGFWTEKSVAVVRLPTLKIMDKQLLGGSKHFCCCCIVRVSLQKKKW